MRVSFPKPAEIRDAVKRQGFVARALQVKGRRPKTLEVEVYAGRKIEPQNFGYVAGTATHLTSGLEHCTLVALFDHNKRVGAAGHFQVEAGDEAAGYGSLNEFIVNLKDMRNTLALMGAARLQAFPVFGMTGAGMIAPVLDVLQVLNSLGIPVPGVSICADGDNVYQSYLKRGMVNYYLDGTQKTKLLFKASPNPMDRAAPILRQAEVAIAYFEDICGEHGRSDFMNFALLYLAAKYFDRPSAFLKRAKRAVDIGSYKPLSSIGQYFRSLVKV